MQNKQETILPFFILILLLSIPFWILDTVYPIELLPGLPLSALGVLAPTLAACILVYKNERFPGVLQLLKRSFDFKRIQKKSWILVAILLNPVIGVLAFGSMRAGGISLPNPAPLTLTVFPLFVVFFISALAEEIGWTGYATEPLMRRWGIVTASLLLGQEEIHRPCQEPVTLEQYLSSGGKAIINTEFNPKLILEPFAQLRLLSRILRIQPDN